MPAFNYSRAQLTCDRQIRRFGGKDALTARLIRAGVQRPCIAARLDYAPKFRDMHKDGASNMLISAVNLAVPPDEEQDVVLFGGKLWKIVEPVNYFHQGGTDTALYYDCAVMFSAGT